MGKCPVCKTYVKAVIGQSVAINVGGSRWKGVSYQCPNPVCQTILGCEIDPNALREEIVAAVIAQLKQLILE